VEGPVKGSEKAAVYVSKTGQSFEAAAKVYNLTRDTVARAWKRLFPGVLPPREMVKLDGPRDVMAARYMHATRVRHTDAARIFKVTPEAVIMAWDEEYPREEINQELELIKMSSLARAMIYAAELPADDERWNQSVYVEHTDGSVFFLRCAFLLQDPEDPGWLWVISEHFEELAFPREAIEVSVECSLSATLPEVSGDS
jgi:uncharacterized protein (DUF433 family)